jgi:ADP-heptose:LPS heptosyltransferase
LGLSVSDTILKLSAPKLFTNQAEMLLKRLGINQVPFAIIHPFSGWFYRSWSIENFEIVANRLTEEGIHSILIGSKADADTLAAKMEFKRNVHLLFDESLAAVIGLIGKASLFIGNDSGPLHLATALGIPCVGMYGPASPTLTAPRSNKNIYLYKQVECSPCNQTHCIRQHDPCINLISSGDVVHAAISILKREAAGTEQ